MRKVLFIILVLLILAGDYLFFVDGPIDAAAYRPPPAPAMTGVLAPNAALKAGEILGRGQIGGPEDVDVDAQGRVYGGTEDGRILRIDAQGAVTVFAETGGRPAED